MIFPQEKDKHGVITLDFPLYCPIYWGLPKAGLDKSRNYISMNFFRYFENVRNGLRKRAG